MIVAGIDGGSRTLKAVLYDPVLGRVLGRGCRDQGLRQAALAEDLVRELAIGAGVEPPPAERRIATGYARNLIAAGRRVTEITCHARGVRQQVPSARSIIEIGGLDPQGQVADFAMNDRCAAGTGRFLEMLAVRLETSLASLGDLVGASTRPERISSMCVVFAETEIVGLLAAGAQPADILVGVEQAVAERVAVLAGARVAEPVVFTGGVALIPGMREALAKSLGRTVVDCPDPLYTGALGAALLAAG